MSWEFLTGKEWKKNCSLIRNIKQIIESNIISVGHNHKYGTLTGVFVAIILGLLQTCLFKEIYRHCIIDGIIGRCRVIMVTFTRCHWRHLRPWPFQHWHKSLEEAGNRNGCLGEQFLSACSTASNKLHDNDKIFVL